MAWLYSFLAATELLDATAITPEVSQMISLYEDVMRLVFLSNFPGTPDEQADWLESAIVKLNTHLYGMKGVQLTPQFHRILHVADLLRCCRQLRGIDTFKVWLCRLSLFFFSFFPNAELVLNKTVLPPLISLRPC